MVALPAGSRPGRADPARRARRRWRGAVGAVGAVRPLPRRARARGAATTRAPRAATGCIDELRPVFADAPAERDADGAHAAGLQPPGAARELAEQLLGRHAPRGSAPAAAKQASGNGERGRAGGRLAARGDRAGLPGALHRLPGGGRGRAAGLDVEEHFSSGLLRRAARHLREGDLREPMAERRGEGPARGRPGAEGLLAELIVEAGREQADPAMLEVQRLQLELARIERRIDQARAQQGQRRQRARRAAPAGQARVRPRLLRVLEETGS